MAKKSRFGEKVETNRDHYRKSSERLDAWAKWSQAHLDQIVMYNDWLDMPYEE